MEVLEMDNHVTNRTENHLNSAAAFVEGGIQEGCDDSCSICLEEFCQSDPSTVTSCKHEFHLQCILEWCQRSSQCPMCWQSIHLKDPTSQELLDAVERERKIRLTPRRHTSLFRHPTLGDFQLQHLPVGATDADLEERIIQHLAAAAAMGRVRHHLGQRDGRRGWPSGHNHPHFLVLSTHSGPVELSGDDPEEPVDAASPSMPVISSSRDEPSRQISVRSNHISSTSGATLLASMDREGIAFTNRRRSSAGYPSLTIQDGAGPSDLQSFSDSLKSRWNAFSMRYKESISKSMRGWREKLFARNTSMVDPSPEVQREENEGVNSITCGLEHLGARENATARIPSDLSDDSANDPVLGTTNQRITENQGNILVTNGSAPPSLASASSLSC